MESNFFVRWLNDQEVAFRQSSFGRMVVFLTFQSALGGIACMLTLQNDGKIIMVILAAVMALWSNAMFIAQAKVKWSLLVFYASVIINFSIIVINLL